MIPFRATKAPFWVWCRVNPLLYLDKALIDLAVNLTEPLKPSLLDDIDHEVARLRQRPQNEPLPEEEFLIGAVVK